MSCNGDLFFVRVDQQVPSFVELPINSARTHANKDKTFFLLRPFSSDHLGTIHTLSLAASHNTTLVIVMPEVLITLSTVSFNGFVWNELGSDIGIFGNFGGAISSFFGDRKSPSGNEACKISIHQ